jgi:hypothetical protein
MNYELMANSWDGTVIVHNGSGETVPAKSFAELGTYDTTNQHFNISKPSSDSLEAGEIVVVPESIATGAIGIAYIGGIHTVVKDAAETVVAGDRITAKSSDWNARQDDDGPYHCLYVSGSDLICRFVGSGGGGTPVYGSVVLVIAQEDAQSDAQISCKLADTATPPVATGSAFDVTGSIVNAGSVTGLDECTPRIESGDLLFATKHGNDVYYFIELFEPDTDCDCYSAP